MSAPGEARGAVLRYPAAAVAADLLRAGAGVLAAGAPLAFARPPGWLSLVLVALLVLFLAFLVQALARVRRRYHVDDDGLSVAPGGARIRWNALELLRLDFYSTRRDGRGGWLELRLRGGGHALRVDSRLGGFDDVLARAVQAADGCGLALTPATVANLDALGVRRAGVPQ